MQSSLSLQNGNKTIIHVSINDLILSRFNPRRTRPAEKISALATRIQRNGFEVTRALWAYQAGEVYEVFAGGTRLEAARLAEIAEVPIVLHVGFSEDDIARLADEDNENDEYHEKVSILDIWAEYWRLNKEEGWARERVAKAKGVHINTVGLRIRLHESAPSSMKKAVTDGVFDEGHCEAISAVVTDVCDLAPWLTSAQAQSELAEEVLGKHRGSSTGIKPTVAVVRAAAKRWKEMIAEAEARLEQVPEEWRARFVDLLVLPKARNVAAVQGAFAAVAKERATEARRQEDEARRQQSEAEAERVRLEQEAAKEARLASVIAKIRLGDARELIHQAPAGFNLLLTDPPYGKNYQGNRRVTTAKKDAIAFDDDSALALLEDVLAVAYQRMAENSHALIFTDWQHEPEFRQAIERSGFAIKGSLVWIKNNHGTGDLLGSFAPKHERIIHAVKGRPLLSGRPADVLHGKDKQNSEHPTEKPLDLLKMLIEATTEPGEMVVDPFAGSGSTLFAALESDRDFQGYEIEERWYRLVMDGLHSRATEQDDSEG